MNTLSLSAESKSEPRWQWKGLSQINEHSVSMPISCFYQTQQPTPPRPSLPSPPPHPPTWRLPWGAKGARRKCTLAVRVTCECPDSGEMSLVALLKQLFRQDRTWVRWCPGSWVNGDVCAAALALLSILKGLICGSKLWFFLPLTSLTLRVFTPEIMLYSMLSSRLPQISLERK